MYIYPKGTPVIPWFGYAFVLPFCHIYLILSIWHSILDPFTLQWVSLQHVCTCILSNLRSTVWMIVLTDSVHPTRRRLGLFEICMIEEHRERIILQKPSVSSSTHIASCSRELTQFVTNGDNPENFGLPESKDDGLIRI